MVATPIHQKSTNNIVFRPTMAYELLETNAVLHIPPTVRLCPYCGGKLVCQFSGWTEDGEGGWMADCVELECSTAPELDDDNAESCIEWNEWMARHSEMPYVYWLPATVEVEKWINERYRFRIN